MVKLEGMIEDITVWIARNIEKRITIDDVARRAGYSKWHLQRVFFQEKNITLAEWIRNEKLTSCST